MKPDATDRIFNPKAIKYIKWWEHIILWFIPAFVTCDGPMCLRWKKWNGKLYLMGELKPLR